MNSNVTATPTAPDGTQGWICKVCGGTFHYSQPIGFGLQLAMLGAFMAAHIHDAYPEPAPAPGPSVLVDILAHAQQCALDGVFLDAGRREHLQLAADVQALVKLLLDLRREASGSVPHCLNLDALNRQITGLTRPQPGC